MYNNKNKNFNILSITLIVILYLFYNFIDNYSYSNEIIYKGYTKKDIITFYSTKENIDKILDDKLFINNKYYRYEITNISSEPLDYIDNLYYEVTIKVRDYISLFKEEEIIFREKEITIKERIKRKIRGLVYAAN